MAFNPSEYNWQARDSVPVSYFTIYSTFKHNGREYQEVFHPDIGSRVLDVSANSIGERVEVKPETKPTPAPVVPEPAVVVPEPAVVVPVAEPEVPASPVTEPVQEVQKVEEVQAAAEPKAEETVTETKGAKGKKSK